MMASAPRPSTRYLPCHESQRPVPRVGDAWKVDLLLSQSMPMPLRSIIKEDLHHLCRASLTEAPVYLEGNCAQAWTEQLISRFSSLLPSYRRRSSECPKFKRLAELVKSKPPTTLLLDDHIARRQFRLVDIRCLIEAHILQQ